MKKHPKQRGEPNVSTEDAEFLKVQTARLEMIGYVFGGVKMGFGQGNEGTFLKAADKASLVTFREFRELMERRNHTVDELVNMFRGKIEEPREFFERVLAGRVKIDGRYEDRNDSIIPYRSVIEFYTQELHFFKDVAKQTQRFCRCHCGKPVFGQHKYTNESCRKRFQRRQAFVPVGET